MFTQLLGRAARRARRVTPDRSQRRPRPLGFDLLEDRSLPSAAFVLDWNELVMDVQRLRSQGNQQSARGLAMMNAAIYDSVNAIDPTHTVYHVDARVFPDVAIASPGAAAAQAAHDVAAGLYTNSADLDRFNTLLADQLAELTDDPAAEDAGVALGAHVAAQILVWRTGDGSGASVPYEHRFEPGQWRPTPPNFNQTPATPHWRYVTPFAMESGDQFRSGPPAALTSTEYTEAFEEVKSLGSINSTTRTAEQTEIAHFWAGAAGGMVSNAGVMVWNQIARTVAVSHDLSLAQNARLFAQMSVANADAFIAGFDVKYEYNYWRPVTAIRAADTDGNPDTAQDADWTPLLATPNHQSFMSLHSVQSRAAAESLAAFFGTDRVGFTATWNGVDRSFNKFTDAAKEAGKSRIYGGIHWSFDSAIGEQMGRKIGQYVADNYFQPLGGKQSGGNSPAGPGSGHGSGHGPSHRGGEGNQLRVAAPASAGEAPGDSQVTPASAGAASRGQAAGLGGAYYWMDDDALEQGSFADAAPSDQGDAGREHDASGVTQDTQSDTQKPVGPEAPEGSLAGTFMLFSTDAAGDILPGLAGEQ